MRAGLESRSTFLPRLLPPGGGKLGEALQLLLPSHLLHLLPVRGPAGWPPLPPGGSGARAPLCRLLRAQARGGLQRLPAPRPPRARLQHRTAAPRPRPGLPPRLLPLPGAGSIRLVFYFVSAGLLPSAGLPSGGQRVLPRQQPALLLLLLRKACQIKVKHRPCMKDKNQNQNRKLYSIFLNKFLVLFY